MYILRMNIIMFAINTYTGNNVWEITEMNKMPDKNEKVR